MTRRSRKRRRRYEQDTPGERVQMDVWKIGSKLYHYTAIDDCTRLKVIKLYPNKTANSTLDLSERIVAGFPFPLQRLQTERKEEFLALTVQQRLLELHIKFRPIKPCSPHLNGKVERTQTTELEEFYALADPRTPALEAQLQHWQEFYHRQRRHCSSKNKTPWQKWEMLAALTPNWAQVRAAYKPENERIRCHDYRLDMS